MLEISEPKMNEPGSLTEEPQNLLLETIYYLTQLLFEHHNMPRVILGSKDIKINKTDRCLFSKEPTYSSCGVGGEGGQQTLK